jgi:hypothetical protein
MLTLQEIEETGGKVKPVGHNRYRINWYRAVKTGLVSTNVIQKSAYVRVLPSGEILDMTVKG